MPRVARAPPLINPQCRWKEVQYERQIGTIRDRVVQMAVVLVLEPIFETDLQPEQHAYRPDHSALDAVRQVHGYVSTGHTEVVDADLSGYFETAS
jgi:RNA-directed DNA polymerase